MKKSEFTIRAVLFMAITIAIGSIITGCALFSSPDRPGYQAGRTTAVAYIATENMLPNEARVACEVGYQVLVSIYGDEAVEADAIDDDLDRCPR